MKVAELFATLGLKPDEHSFKRGHDAIESVKHALEIFVGFEAVKYVGELIKKTGEGAIGASRLAQKLGTTSEAIQKLGYAADVTGASVEDMQVFMQHMSLQMAEAAKTGKGPLVDALGKLGISFAAFQKMTPEQRIERLADAFAEAGPEVNKTAIAMQLGGRSGTALIPLFNRGGQAVRQLGNEFEAMGGVIDEEGIKQFEELEETEKKLHGTMTGLKNQAVIALLPALREMADSLLEWVKANREVIASTLRAVIQALVVAFHALGVAVSYVAKVVDFFVEHAELGKAVLIAFGVVVGALGAQAAAAWLIGFAPVVGAIAAVAAIILGVTQLIKHFDKVKAIAASVWSFIKRQITTVWEALKSIPGGIVDAFKAMGEAIVHAFERVVEFIGNLPVIKQIRELVDKLESLGRRAGALARQIVDASTGPLPEGGAAAITRNVTGMSFAGGFGGFGVTAPMNVTINAGNADANKVGDIIDGKVQEHHDRVWRDFMAATRGSEDER